MGRICLSARSLRPVALRSTTRFLAMYSFISSPLLLSSISIEQQKRELAKDEKTKAVKANEPGRIAPAKTAASAQNAQTKSIRCPKRKERREGEREREREHKMGREGQAGGGVYVRKRPLRFWAPRLFAQQKRICAPPATWWEKVGRTRSALVQKRPRG